MPQAPVHTDSLTVYKTRLEVVKTEDGDEIRQPLVEATAVIEQRGSHFLMGIAIWGTMTEPLFTVLSTMPAAVFAGVLFVVGVCASFTYHSDVADLVAVRLFREQRHPQEVLDLNSEKRFVDPTNPLNTVPRKIVW